MNAYEPKMITALVLMRDLNLSFPKPKFWDTMTKVQKKDYVLEFFEEEIWVATDVTAFVPCDEV